MLPPCPSVFQGTLSSDTSNFTCTWAACRISRVCQTAVTSKPVVRGQARWRFGSAFAALVHRRVPGHTDGRTPRQTLPETLLRRRLIILLSRD
jgi:hypothetical protein